MTRMRTRAKYPPPWGLPQWSAVSCPERRSAPRVRPTGLAPVERCFVRSPAMHAAIDSSVMALIPASCQTPVPRGKLGGAELWAQAASGFQTHYTETSSVETLAAANNRRFACRGRENRDQQGLGLMRRSFSRSRLRLGTHCREALPRSLARRFFVAFGLIPGKSVIAPIVVPTTVLRSKPPTSTSPCPTAPLLAPPPTATCSSASLPCRWTLSAGMPD